MGASEKQIEGYWAGLDNAERSTPLVRADCADHRTRPPFPELPDPSFSYSTHHG